MGAGFCATLAGRLKIGFVLGLIGFALGLFGLKLGLNWL